MQAPSDAEYTFISSANLRPMQVPLEFDGRDSPMMSGTRAVSLLTGAC
jgi:hypothetical protein